MNYHLSISYFILFCCLNVQAMEIETEIVEDEKELATFPIQEEDKYISVVYSLMNQKLKVLDNGKISFQFYYNEFLKRPIEWAVSIEEINEYIIEVKNYDPRKFNPQKKRGLREYEIGIIDRYCKILYNDDLPDSMVIIKDAIDRFKAKNNWVNFHFDLRSKDECDIYQKLLNWLNDLNKATSTQENLLADDELHKIRNKIIENRRTITLAIESKDIDLLRKSLDKPVMLKEYLNKIKSKKD